jgi:hypothetical protein
MTLVAEAIVGINHIFLQYARLCICMWSIETSKNFEISITV